MSKSFSLTHPTPSTRPPRNDGRDYSSEAVDLLLEAKHCNLDFEDAYRELSTVSQRLVKGDLWLRERGPSNPKYQQAQRQHATLSRRQGELLMLVKVRYVALYLTCCALHGCLNALGPDDTPAWLERHAGNAFTNDLRSIWQSFQPCKAIPFNGVYPEPTQALHIEGGFSTPEKLEAWFNRTGQETT